MTEQEAVTKINTECFSGDNECDHSSADVILCEFLTALGYVKLVEAWNKVEKWYA